MGLLDKLFGKNAKNGPSDISELTLKKMQDMSPEQIDKVLDSVPLTDDGVEVVNAATARLSREGAEREKQMLDEMNAEAGNAEEAFHQQSAAMNNETDKLNEKNKDAYQLTGIGRSAAAAHATAVKLSKELDARAAQEQAHEQRRNFDKKYDEMIKLSEKMLNGQKDDRVESLPEGIRDFTLIAFYKEKEACGYKDGILLSGYEIASMKIKQNNGHKYDDLNKRILLSMGILVHLGLLDVEKITDKSKLEMFEKTIATINLSEYNGRSLRDVVLSISNAIEEPGLLDAFFEGRLPINDHSSHSAEPKPAEKDTPNVLYASLPANLNERIKNALTAEITKLLDHGIPEEQILGYINEILKLQAEKNYSTRQIMGDIYMRSGALISKQNLKNPYTHDNMSR